MDQLIEMITNVVILEGEGESTKLLMEENHNIDVARNFLRNSPEGSWGEIKRHWCWSLIPGV